MVPDNPPDTPKHPKRLEDPDKAFVHVGDKRLKKLQKQAWEAGWWPEEKRDGIMWQSPDRRFQVMIHRSDSDHRAFDNAAALFRRFGLDV
jgi:hypothetical protein